ncbi:ribonuclease H-like domain-containing protein [Desarmillaria ectypa]|nr:ribonuclease H-like domain-containing protein [Desarmillaria ectypa]
MRSEAEDYIGRGTISRVRPASNAATVYCDGACRRNGNAGAIAGVGVWWSHGDSRNISERCPGRQSNNRAELIALVRVHEQTMDVTTPLTIKTDSKYSIHCMETWLRTWQLNGFMGSKHRRIENEGIIRYLAKLRERARRLGRRVALDYVPGHTGVEGNEEADRHATEGTYLPEVEEPDWVGLRKELDVKMNAELTERKRKLLSVGYVERLARG